MSSTFPQEHIENYITPIKINVYYRVKPPPLLLTPDESKEKGPGGGGGVIRLHGQSLVCKILVGRFTNLK